MVLHKQVLNLTDDDNCLLQKEQATLIGAVTGAVTPGEDEDVLASFSWTQCLFLLVVVLNCSLLIGC